MELVRNTCKRNFNSHIPTLNDRKTQYDFGLQTKWANGLLITGAAVAQLLPF